MPRSKSLRRLALAAALLSSLSLAGAARADVLNFDDLADGLVPLNYGGLDWSSFGWTAFSTAVDPYTAHSGAGRLASGFLASDASSLIGFKQAVRFDGAWFAGQSGAVLSFELFYQGQRVAGSQSLDPSATPSFLASGYAGLVDAVQVKSQNHGEFVMDDFSFTPAVPEPHSYALLLGGLAGMGALVRRRRQA